MDKTLKVAHLVALALFVGSVPAHILLFALAERSQDAQGFALLMNAKYMCVQVLTLPALFLTLATGVALMVRQDLTPVRARSMAAKLALVALIALNGLFVLRPTARDLSALADNAIGTGSRTNEIAELERREGLYGNLNLAMILAVFVISVFRPQLGQNASKLGEVKS